MIEPDETSLTGSVWPVHLKPQVDELLSSWLTRLALAHGQTVASFTNLVWPGSRPRFSRPGSLEGSGDVCDIGE